MTKKKNLFEEYAIIAMVEADSKGAEKFLFDRRFALEKTIQEMKTNLGIALPEEKSDFLRLTIRFQDMAYMLGSPRITKSADELEIVAKELEDIYVELKTIIHRKRGENGQESC